MSQSHVPQSTLPLPFDAARVVRTFEALKGKGYESQGRAREILASACGNSPYLARLAIREGALLGDLFELGPDAIVARAIHHALAAAGAGSREEAMTGLRAAKREAALAIALADIGGAFDFGA